MMDHADEGAAEAVAGGKVAAEAFVLAGDRRRGHADIRARGARGARGFSELGVGPGEAVALLLRNDFAFFEASLGATLAGAYPVPINWHASPEEAAYILRDSGAKVLVAHRDLLGAVLPEAASALPCLVVETPAEIRAAYDVPPDAALPLGVRDWDAWLARHAPIAAPASGARPAVIYTSGTTGRPKGVRRSARPRSEPSPRALAVYGLDDGRPITALINGPMYHAVPNAYGRLALQAGATIVLQARFEPEAMLALIERHRVSHMHIVPAMFVRLLRLPEAVRARYDVGSLRHVVHGAAPCPAAIKAAMIAWWGPVIHEYYGSTETGLLTFHDAAEALRRPGTVGRALPGIDLEILDANGDPLPAGTVGEVYAGSATMRDFTYVGRDDARAAVERRGLVTAGDVGWLDADGYLFLRDRKRDVIVSDGVEIYPADIEAALLAIPGVQDCAVFGIPDAGCGEIVCAAVEPAAGHRLDPADLLRRLEGTVGRRLLPRQIDVVAGLPREDSGKIFKNRLRALALDRRGVRDAASG
ncbi:AMP-binding protein [uncultured Methylobacterium sp.]|uniref:AMP-binding protein n=1 Tax=uncultured Methylobacterium sp. TaxID=157278 RepID=UPI0035CC9416